jgi:single-strand DNA-binding protein
MAENMCALGITGNLTRDAELTYTGSGTALLKFSIACNERQKTGEQWGEYVSFFDCIMWGKRGEALAQYMLQGKMVGVEGRIRQERWEAKDGTKRSKVVIKADNIQLFASGNREHKDEDVGPTPSKKYDDDIAF